MDDLCISPIDKHGTAFITAELRHTQKSVGAAVILGAKLLFQLEPGRSQSTSKTAEPPAKSTSSSSSSSASKSTSSSHCGLCDKIVDRLAHDFIVPKCGHVFNMECIHSQASKQPHGPHRLADQNTLCPLCAKSKDYQGPSLESFESLVNATGNTKSQNDPELDDDGDGDGGQDDLSYGLDLLLQEPSNKSKTFAEIMHANMDEVLNPHSVDGVIEDIHNEDLLPKTILLLETSLENSKHRRWLLLSIILPFHMSL